MTEETLPDDVGNAEIPDGDPAPAETVTVSGDNLTVTETPPEDDGSTTTHGPED
jgi:hypothetical protein